jgi:hypothetical protein
MQLKVIQLNNVGEKSFIHRDGLGGTRGGLSMIMGMENGFYKVTIKTQENDT